MLIKNKNISNVFKKEKNQIRLLNKQRKFDRMKGEKYEQFK